MIKTWQPGEIFFLHLKSVFVVMQGVGAKSYMFLLDDTVRNNSFYHMIIIQEITLLALCIQLCWNLIYNTELVA